MVGVKQKHAHYFMLKSVSFYEGFRLPITVGGLGGDGVGSVVKADRQVYGEQRLLYSI